MLVVMVRLLTASLPLLLALPACSSRSVDDTGDDQAETIADDPGDQPTAPGTMYSPCGSSDECPPQEFCVFPQGESGYCTSACAAPTDPSNCDLAPGDQPRICFDIGLDDGRLVCAIDCADASCPRGMRCEQVASGDREPSICF